MNQFLEKFSDPIKSFWETGSEQEKQKLLTDILHYANTNPEKFKQELQEVQFDKELTPLAVVLEALSKDTDKWGQFYVDVGSPFLVPFKSRIFSCYNQSYGA